MSSKMQILYGQLAIYSSRTRGFIDISGTRDEYQRAMKQLPELLFDVQMLLGSGHRWSVMLGCHAAYIAARDAERLKIEGKNHDKAERKLEDAWFVTFPPSTCQNLAPDNVKPANDSGNSEG